MKMITWTLEDTEHRSTTTGTANDEEKLFIVKNM